MPKPWRPTKRLTPIQDTWSDQNVDDFVNSATADGSPWDDEPLDMEEPSSGWI